MEHHPVRGVAQNVCTVARRQALLYPNRSYEYERNKPQHHLFQNQGLIGRFSKLFPPFTVCGAVWLSALGPVPTPSLLLESEQ